MTRKLEIPEPTKSEIEAVRDLAKQAYKAGNKIGFATHIEQAWGLIPEPKYSWDYYPQTFSMSLVRVYKELGQVESMKKWIERGYLAYDDPSRENLYTLKIEGDALLTLDLVNDAYLVFKRVFELYGREGFPGEHMKYLEFYLKERAKRHG